MIPVDKIERVYFPRRGLRELMAMSKNDLDEHLKKVHSFVTFLLQSGLTQQDLGITYSTLMGHYLSNISDINVVVYGKKNYWKLMQFLQSEKHDALRWKTEEEWLAFYKRRNRSKLFTKEEFLQNMGHKKSEGFFDNTLFVIFGAENEDDTWYKWGSESYEPLNTVIVEGIVEDNTSSVVRPGFYGLKDSKIVEGHENVPVKKVVFYSRDYCMVAFPGDKIKSCGLLEKVIPKDDEPYYRVVVGYFDAYTNERRDKEFVKVVEKK